MDQILMSYYEGNARKLRRMVDGILRKIGGMPVKEKEDFYSLANEVFVDVMRRYDCTKPFDSFLYSCLSNRIKTELTKRNREKRGAGLTVVSIDTPVRGEEETVGDRLASDFDVETVAVQNIEPGYSKRMTCYLNRLSALQRKVLVCIVEGYSPAEIQRELHISRQKYADCSAAIHSYRNIEVLL